MRCVLRRRYGLRSYRSGVSAARDARPSAHGVRFVAGDVVGGTSCSGARARLRSTPKRNELCPLQGFQCGPGRTRTCVKRIMSPLL